MKNYTIITRPEITLVGIGIRTTNEHGQALQDIPKVWSQFEAYDWPEALFTSPAPPLSYGLYTNYESDFTKPYDFYACYACSDALPTNASLTRFHIPAGRYAKFSGKGPARKTVGQLWQTVWATPLERQYTFDLEIYHPKEANGHQHIDVYIAI